MKKTYTINFYAELDDEDVKAMNSCFYSAMEESMDINCCWGLTLDEYPDEESELQYNTISLESDAYELDELKGVLKVDKSVFDDFQKNSVIGICFVDEEDSPTYEYLMTSEDDAYIYMDYFA